MGRLPKNMPLRMRHEHTSPAKMNDEKRPFPAKISLFNQVSRFYLARERPAELIVSFIHFLNRLLAVNGDTNLAIAVITIAARFTGHRKK